MSSPEFLSQGQPADFLREAILRHVRYTLVRPTSDLKPADYLKPVSLAIRDRIVDRLLETESRYRHKDSKKLYYLSMEFLMGRSLADNLANLRVAELCREVLAGLGVSLDEVLDSEPDAGLGNGGLGRLAACFLESLATLGMAGYGYGIDYEYGMFKQEIFNGFQREKPDRWKANGTPFEIEHPEDAVNIPLYGRVETGSDPDENLKQSWIGPKIVVGIPADMPIVGYLGQTVNWLRLFGARASEDFDIEIFNRGDYIRAVEQKIASENISRLLYPADSVMSGKELRLVQEYFLVACAIGDLMRRFRQQHKDIDSLPSKVAIQLNDTHPEPGGGRADARLARRRSSGMGPRLGHHAAHPGLYQSHSAARSAGKVVGAAVGESAAAAHADHLQHQPSVLARDAAVFLPGWREVAQDVDH